MARKVYLLPAQSLSLDALKKIFNDNRPDARRQTAASDVGGEHKDVSATN